MEARFVFICPRQNHLQYWSLDCHIGLMFNMFNKYKNVINIFQIQVYIYLYVSAGSFVSFADIFYFVVDR